MSFDQSFSYLITVITALFIAYSLPLQAAAEEAQLLNSFESQNELRLCNAATGSLSLSNKHATHASYSAKFDFTSGNPRFTIRINNPTDITQYRKVKFDVFVEGAPVTVTAKFHDNAGNTYTSWYYLYNSGHNVVEYAVHGIDTKINPTQLSSIDFSTEKTLATGTTSTLYIDNLRLTSGPDDDSWLLKTPDTNPLLKVEANLLTNGDFELGTQGWNFWGAYDGGQYILSSGKGDNAKSGAFSAAMICEKQGRAGIRTQIPTLKPGNYKFIYWIKGSAPGVRMFHAFEGSVTRNISPYSSNRFAVPTTWTKKEYNLKVSSTSESGSLYFYSTGTGTLFIDAVSLVNTDAAPTDDQKQHSAQTMTPRKVTIEKNRVLVNGKPFFCIGLYGGVPSQLTKTGFNFATSADLDQCEKYNIMTWVNTQGLARSHALLKTAEFVRPIKNHPALLCYHNCDEPDHSDFNVPPPEIRVISKILHEEDANHPTSSVIMAWAPSNLYQYADTVDILLADPYMWNVSEVVKCVDILRRAAGPGKPIWAVLRAAWGGEKPPSDQYLYGTTYGSITHSADGILWFSQSGYSQHDSLENTLNKISLELKQLAPVLVADTSTKKVNVSNDNIHTILKDRNGSLFLITVNVGTTPQNDVRITIPSLNALSADVLFEDRAVIIKRKSITDNFNIGERHVYRFTTKPRVIIPSRPQY